MSAELTVATTAEILDRSARAVRRLHMLHDLYAPASRRVLTSAGLQAGMNIADVGCGVGVTTRMLAELTGPTGAVVAIDIDPGHLKHAKTCCGGLRNVSFWRADACRTGLPRGVYDLVYSRFLLVHLSNPLDGLREMRALLRPGGILVVEESDFASAGSEPPTAIDAFGTLFADFAPTLGLDMSVGRTLFHTVVRAGLHDVNVGIHQPAITRGENRVFLKWSVEEAGPAFVDAGVITAEALDCTLREMQHAIDDPAVLILAPQMFSVSARNPECVAADLNAIDCGRMRYGKRSPFTPQRRPSGGALPSAQLPCTNLYAIEPSGCSLEGRKAY